jgi:quercetin dioxygenase-like cupin family protein
MSCNAPSTCSWTRFRPGRPVRGLLFVVAAAGSLAGCVRSAPPASPMHSAARATPGGPPDPRLVATCDPVSDAPPVSATGCFIVAQGDLPPQPENSIYWQIRRFERRDQAEAARGPSDLVAEAEGSAWLFRFGPKQATEGPGEHVADVGPFALPAARRHHAMVLYAPLHPGAYTGVHRHSGPEVWYVLGGEQCLETPAGVHVHRTGESFVAPTGVPMKLTITGTGLRRSFAVVVHDAAQGWAAPVDSWQPRGLCGKEN